MIALLFLILMAIVIYFTYPKIECYVKKRVDDYFNKREKMTMTDDQFNQLLDRNLMNWLNRNNLIRRS